MFRLLEAFVIFIKASSSLNIDKQDPFLLQLILGNHHRAAWSSHFIRLPMIVLHFSDYPKPHCWQSVLRSRTCYIHVAIINRIYHFFQRPISQTHFPLSIQKIVGRILSVCVCVCVLCVYMCACVCMRLHEWIAVYWFTCCVLFPRMVGICHLNNKKVFEEFFNVRVSQ